MATVLHYAPETRTFRSGVSALLRGRRRWLGVVATAASLYGLSLAITLERVTDTADCRVCGVSRVSRTWKYGGVAVRARTEIQDAYGYLAEFGEDHQHAWLPQRRYRDRGSAWGYEGIPCRLVVLRPELVRVYAAMEEVRRGFPGTSTAQRRDIYRELLSLPSVGDVEPRAARFRAALD